LPKTIEKRFWSKVDKTPTCWLWTAGKFTQGYGNFTVSGKSVKAHRFAYELLRGAIPDGLDLDHKCRNRACVNPAHLRPATRKQNMENRSGSTSGNRSGVRGVTWYPPRQNWSARVGHCGRVVFVGYFDTVDAAEAAVIAKRKELFTHSEMDKCA
jgi:hypothetical protein